MAINESFANPETRCDSAKMRCTGVWYDDGVVSFLLVRMRRGIDLSGIFVLVFLRDAGPV